MSDGRVGVPHFLSFQTKTKASLAAWLASTGILATGTCVVPQFPDLLDGICGRVLFERRSPAKVYDLAALSKHIGSLGGGQILG